MAMPMLTYEKIAMGRLCQAYGLTAEEAHTLIQTLWPDKVFPLELWQTAHETYWSAFARRNAALYGVENPSLPDVDRAKPFEAYFLSCDIMSFFQKLAGSIHVNALNLGLQYVLEAAYDDADAVFPEERNSLMRSLSQIYGQSTGDYDSLIQKDIDWTSGEKVSCIPASNYHFISSIFLNTVLVDKIAVIRLLAEYPLRHEVKGLTKSIVVDILNSPPSKGLLPATVQPENEPAMSRSEEFSCECADSETLPVSVPPMEKTPAPTMPDAEAIPVPRSLWDGKSPEAICTGMRAEGFDAEVIAHILFCKRGLKKRAVAKLLHAPNLSDYAYDKKGQELYKSALSIRTADAD